MRALIEQCETPSRLRDRTYPKRLKLVGQKGIRSMKEWKEVPNMTIVARAMQLLS